MNGENTKESDTDVEKPVEEVQNEHAPQFPAVLVTDEPDCMNSPIQAAITEPPFDYSVYSNPEFDGLPVLGPYRYMQGSSDKPNEWTINMVYQGQYKHGVKHGAGKLVWPDGTVYEGFFYNDQANYIGRLLHADGDIYCGGWSQDRSGGFGTFIHPDGAWYSGTWKDDRQHGQRS